MGKVRTLMRAIAGPRGPEAFAAAVKVFRVFYRNRYPFHWNDLSWFDDRSFWDILRRYGDADGFNAHRRKLVYEIACAAIRSVQGDTAECGCFKGLSSHLICSAIKDCCLAESKRHYVFNSFEGLSAPTSTDGSYWSQGNRACDELTVRTNLGEFDFVEYKKGWIPDRFAEVAANTFCFVHIDVDLAAPTKDSLEFFFPRLNSGGAIIVDDYGFATCPGVTQLVNEFMRSHPEALVVRSPVGGAVIFKSSLLAQG